MFDEFSTSKVSLTVRYKFNTTKSQYKGTGAGQGQKDRDVMQLYFISAYLFDFKKSS